VNRPAALGHANHLWIASRMATTAGTRRSPSGGALCWAAAPVAAVRFGRWAPPRAHTWTPRRTYPTWSLSLVRSARWCLLRGRRAQACGAAVMSAAEGSSPSSAVRESASSHPAGRAISDAGVIGLAVMGQNFALNLASHGWRVSVYNRTYARTAETVERAQRELAADDTTASGSVTGFADLRSFVLSLKRPRRVFLLVKAGSAVDATVEALAEVLEPGDIIVDGGNEWYENTERRAASVAARGLLYVGMGVSGGEEGARYGPSLMPGGSREAYQQLAPLLEQVAAQVPGSGPCVTYIGPGGSGNYVKMVHNGIEYGDMQLIGEAYDLLRGAVGLDAMAAAEVFASWNAGALQSFLVEITARILRVPDTSSSAASAPALVDQILDRSESKGTGLWTMTEALRRGVAVPTIAAALDGRYLSARKDERERASRVLRGPERLSGTGHASELAAAGASPGAAGGVAETGPDTVPERVAALASGSVRASASTSRSDASAERALIAAIEDALFCSKLCSYAQGLSLLQRASGEQGWSLDLGELARIWKGGCIIRAQLLERIEGAFRRDPSLPNLLLDADLAAEIGRRHESWRRIVGLAASLGVPAPALTASLSYYDTYRQAVLRSSQLVQAQRDCFGSHGYERLDDPGRRWHTRWLSGGDSAGVSS
jgi:6-phosphogluconate dehydrogenase